VVDWMRVALAEAAKVADAVYPYPGVGVVITSNGSMVSKAHNGQPGEPHAEAKAILEAKKGSWNLEECELYTNLEPCTNSGLQLPCTQEIINADIKKVHISIQDPYHLVRGQGVDSLSQAGIEVSLGEYAEESAHMIRRYLERFCSHCGWPYLNS
jgi:diaminohydroxyphosphoribosylaminopyrimidine deaminase/5-amino-6-(5-phosphoribosylamino)uracil reductase